VALVRKNLVVDAERVRALAQQRGLSESAAVREAVDYALAAGEIMDAVRALHDSGAFADFEELFPTRSADAEGVRRSMSTRGPRRIG
jgi:hypothetical protein